jgi:pyridoxamine 5'-phosphate oxidase
MHTDPVDVSALRRSYRRAELDETTLAADWHEQLTRWFFEAVEDERSIEPNAVQLATVDAAGRPSVRTVLVKSFDERGVVFYTNYGSRKGRDLAARPYASAVFVWLALERQVRLSGAVAKVPREETEAYFAARPRGSQLGAWASPQSEVVPSRGALEAGYAEAERRFAGSEVPPPPHWGGYRLTPETVEFWQGRADRLHDRLRFRSTDDGWVVERLAP